MAKGGHLSEKEVHDQSMAAINQWGPTWEINAKANGLIHSIMPRSHKELLYSGLGKTSLILAMGPSLEKRLDEIKAAKAVDIIAVDKCFLYLARNGVKMKAICVADANVSYEKYAEPVIDKSEGVMLIANVTCNPKWAKNWKGPVFFYVNKDNLGSEEKYGPLSGVTEALPAGSNVGNTAVIFATQICGYDVNLMCGFDYCWEAWGNYYSFAWEPVKRGFMNHIMMVDAAGKFVQTSTNLQFSARWLGMYVSEISKLGIHVVNCSDGGIIPAVRQADLKTQLKLAVSRVGRKWTPQEKEKFIRAHSEEATLNPAQAGNLKQILSDPAMATLQVTLRGVQRGVLAYAEQN